MLDLTALKRPTTPEEAVRDLLHTEGTGLYVAGGTIVVPAGSPNLDYLVDLTRTGLDYVRVEQAAEHAKGRAERVLVIGATTRISDLLDEAALDAPCWRSIKEASFSLATHTVRNKATVGGNVIVAQFPTDLPPVFASLNATIVLQGESRRREISLEDFYTRPTETRERGDLIVEVRVPSGPDGMVTTFDKTGRVRADIAIVNCAAALVVDGGKIAYARIGLNGVAAVPFIAKKAAEFLAGASPEDEVFKEAGRIVSESVSPRSDHRASADYRRKVAGTLTERVLARAAAFPDHK